MKKKNWISIFWISLFSGVAPRQPQVTKRLSVFLQIKRIVRCHWKNTRIIRKYLLFPWNILRWHRFSIFTFSALWKHVPFGDTREGCTKCWMSRLFLTLLLLTLISKQKCFLVGSAFSVFVIAMEVGGLRIKRYVFTISQEKACSSKITWFRDSEVSKTFCRTWRQCCLPIMYR